MKHDILRSEVKIKKERLQLHNIQIAELIQCSSSAVSRFLNRTDKPTEKAKRKMLKFYEMSDEEIDSKLKKDDKPKEQTEYREIKGNNGKRYLLIKRKSGEEIIEL